jgi:opacity protein-like surface antigen
MQPVPESWWRALGCGVLLCVSLQVHAQVDVDADSGALMLADHAPAVLAQASNWRTFVEGAAGAATARNDASQGVQRISLDTRYDGVLAPGLRVQWADRLDVNAPAQTVGDNGINTLEEAYVSWQPDQARALDVGRINQRNGVSLGYNPTDYFKTGALRSVVSVDPQSLKENRQGSVMVRGQQLWRTGSVTALFSPKLQSQPDTSSFALDLGATNNSNRALLIYSPQWSETISPQFLLFQQDQAEPEIGVNMSALLNDSTVGRFEWSGVQSLSQRSQALAAQGLAHPNDSSFYSRWVLGLSYATDSKVTVDVEYAFNGLGLGKADWNQLRSDNPASLALYQSWVQGQQQLPTQQSTFLRVAWQDAVIQRLDLSAMQRYDLDDDSSMLWLEVRLRLAGRSEVALQWLRNQGGALSDYGVLPVKQNFLLVWRSYI